VEPACVLAGRGSDEGIDLLTRAFCRSGRDAVLVCPPTFGMYAVAAKIQGAEVVSVPLLPHSGFALDAAGVLAALSERVRIIYLCSPNNPTGNSFDRDAMAGIVAAAAGRALVVIDEAYLEFSGEPSMAGLMASWPHVVVLRTMSKAQGLAGARLGVLIAHHAIVSLLRKIIPPYAITQSTIEMALLALESPQQAVIAFRIKELVRERERLSRALSLSPQVRRVWQSAANFVLSQFVDATTAFERGRAAGLLVRTYLGTPELEQCLRITIGTAEQNDRLIRSLS
jgi:histidinol-phosphate aminotransferase